ncbi:hypothetical protein GQ42DRAFT_162934 [Ramicandelaber brevisporus]|nr:hypothetical protein GQ42DRAFT_162934 [Ramicandelaber brevisporus]
MKVTALAVLALAALATTSFARPSPLSVGVGSSDKCAEGMLYLCLEDAETDANECIGLHCLCQFAKAKLSCYDTWDCQGQSDYDETKKAKEELCA